MGEILEINDNTKPRVLFENESTTYLSRSDLTCYVYVLLLSFTEYAMVDLSEMRDRKITEILNL